MPLSLRPYVTAGVAVAGASVIAIASIQPTPPDVHIPNPVAEVARDVQLTANVTLPSIETQYNDLVLPVTELGLSLTVPPTAAVINAIAPDLIPEGSTAEAVATGLLLRLSGYAISGVGSIGTALQRVIVGFGCPSTGGLCEDLGTGYLALLVGAPSTIIDGFVNGGYGPDLEPLLFGTDTSRVISAGGLINPGALPPPLGGTTEPPFILPGTFPTLQGLAERLLVSDLNDFGGLLGDLLGGLVDNLLGSFGPTTALPSIETQYNDLVLPVTELGLSLTVPPTAAVINAIAPDLIPEGSTAEAVATGLLLRLSGYAISGVGSIGTALQGVTRWIRMPLHRGFVRGLRDRLPRPPRRCSFYDHRRLCQRRVRARPGAPAVRHGYVAGYLGRRTHQPRSPSASSRRYYRASLHSSRYLPHAAGTRRATSWFLISMILVVCLVGSLTISLVLVFLARPTPQL